MCGIAGIFGRTAVAERLYDAMTIIQHRGQDAAGMTTLEELETNYHYFLEFWIDMDGNQVCNTGDLESYADFDVMPSASYSEAKVFRVDLLAVD